MYQIQNGKTHVIAYASRGLSWSEKNYPNYKLEFLVLKWAICKKFHDYLYGISFQVLTDNNSLTYVLSTTRLDIAGHRWLAAPSLYKVEIRYRAGRTNIDTDGLSRIPHEDTQDDEEDEDLEKRVSSLMDRAVHSPDDFKTQSQVVRNVMCLQCHMANAATRSTDDTDVEEEHIALVETLLWEANVVPDILEEPNSLPVSSTLSGLTAVDWQRFQRDDATIKCVINPMESGTMLSGSEKCCESHEVCLLWTFVDKLLYQQVYNQAGQSYNQLVIPESHRERALERVHDETGHMGYDGTLELARARFYWPKMAAAIEQKCKTCKRCLKRKARAQKAAKMTNIKVYSPLQLIWINYLP